LIQQAQYTQATPKYNFPPGAIEDPTLPQRFIELSLRSIKRIRNSEASLYQPYETLTEETVNPSEEITPTFQGQTTLKLRTIQLKPQPNQQPVIAIDVSSIKIGETDTGILLALRAATVWKQDHTAYRYLRFGPFPFHITEENKQEIHQLFNQYSHNKEEPEAGSRESTPSLLQMQTRMTALLEHWLQVQIATQSVNSLLLLDGSLTAGTADTPTPTISQLLDTARNRHNTILAFTKVTRLRLNGRALTSLIDKCKPPCLLQTDGYPTTAYNHIHFLGRIYVAKLGPSPYAFRLDIDSKIPNRQAVESVEHLIANDLVLDGYPETLRLAHIYSTFTANEVIGIQRFLAQTHGIKTVQRPNVRRFLFGPFGKGPIES
jgi:hypothetical protein